MSQCIAIQPDNTLKIVNGVCDYVLITQVELEKIQSTGLVNSLNELFAFDTATFMLINTSALVAFITAHILGRIVRVMGKT